LTELLVVEFLIPKITISNAASQQEAQLSQRPCDDATLHVIEYFAKSRKVTQDHSK